MKKKHEELLAKREKARDAYFNARYNYANDQAFTFFCEYKPAIDSFLKEEFTFFSHIKVEYPSITFYNFNRHQFYKRVREHVAKAYPDLHIRADVEWGGYNCYLTLRLRRYWWQFWIG